MRRRCPVCEVALGAERSAFFPFCSSRCRSVDLGNWIHERYALVDPDETPSTAMPHSPPDD
jgi:endogenous inhibitor of DNA gyrase (YacG/DUF329 family)